MSFNPFALQFYVNTGWHVRPDDAASVARCFQHYLDRLGTVDGVLSTWRIGSGYIPYGAIRHAMTAFIGRNLKIGEDGEPDPQDGFSIRAASTDERQRFSVIGTAGRAYRYPMANELYLRTDSNYPADTTIVTYPLMKGVVLATVAAWRPDCCAAYSSALKPDPVGARYRRAWMTYVSPAHVDGVNLVGVPFSERTPEGGLLLSATDRTFDAADPAHLAGAQRLFEVTRHLNDVVP